MNSLGADIRIDGDLVIGPHGDGMLASELACLGQDLRHRLSTPPGGLLRHPEYGFDLEGWLGRDQTASDQIALRNGILEQIERDPRVVKGSGVVTVVQASQHGLRLKVTCASEYGQVSLVLRAGAEELTEEMRRNGVD